MSRERFEELKAKAEGHIKHKDGRALELQQTITNSASMIALYQQQKEQAEADNNPEAYAEACTLVNMYSDRKRKAEEEQGRGAWEPAIPASLYNEINSFLQAETEQCVKEEIKEILEHLEAAEEIIERAQAYNQELREFSAECERVNRASYTGEYRPMTVGSMPAPLSDGVKELLYHYRRMSQ